LHCKWQDHKHSRPISTALIPLPVPDAAEAGCSQLIEAENACCCCCRCDIDTLLAYSIQIIPLLLLVSELIRLVRARPIVDVARRVQAHMQGAACSILIIFSPSIGAARKLRYCYTPRKLPEDDSTCPPTESLNLNGVASTTSSSSYHAMHFRPKRGIAIACRLSVCLSVRL